MNDKEKLLIGAGFRKNFNTDIYFHLNKMKFVGSLFVNDNPVEVIVRILEEENSTPMFYFHKRLTEEEQAEILERHYPGGWENR